jgi:hypothetical protein
MSGASDRGKSREAAVVGRREVIAAAGAGLLAAAVGIPALARSLPQVSSSDAEEAKRYARERKYAQTRRARQRGDGAAPARLSAQRVPVARAGLSAGAAARDSPGHDRHLSQRRGQGESVPDARLQPRSRHGPGDVCRRHAGQSADACSWTGLLPYPHADAVVGCERPKFGRGTSRRHRFCDIWRSRAGLRTGASTRISGPIASSRMASRTCADQRAESFR